MDKVKKVPGKIQKLDQVVINRIAAGEVIQRPANALKELLENSLDAGSENVQVVVKAGGLKLLQIQDDGSGIRAEDLPIVCERFTTSKLNKFEDLQTIGTFGFRGEALASISHVARLSILTKTAEATTALKAEYHDGALKQYSPEAGVANPKRCAGKVGTTITVEDLFYNMETRRKALKSPTEEYNRVSEVVTRYAIHNHMVGLSLRKAEDTMTDIRTPGNSTALDNIRILFGTPIARELLPVSCEEMELAKFTMKGLISNVNYSTKKLNFILFINNRLVDSSTLRKSIESVYTTFLPKGTHPFVYLSIDIEPRNVDVNVHPTKHEVHFLHEDSIVSHITKAVENVLLGANESRTFLVQSLLPGAGGPSSSLDTSGFKKRKPEVDDSIMDLSSRIIKKQPNDPKTMVRTDPRLQKLERFFLSSTPRKTDNSNLQSFQDSPSALTLDRSDLLECSSQDQPVVGVPLASSQVDQSGATAVTNRPTSASSTTSSYRRTIRLSSVQNMRETIKADCHDGLSDVFRNHIFVGCVDRALAMFQHSTTLYICNVIRLSTELFYQRLVEEFGNFQAVSLEEPVKICDLAAFGLENSVDSMNEGESIQPAVEKICALIMSKRRMLKDYFSLEIDDVGQLIGLPLLINNYFPNLEGLAKYVVDLGQNVDWSDEQRCFETFCDVTAQFYAIPAAQRGENEDADDTAPNGQTWKWTVEHVIFPELKKSFQPPNTFAGDSTIIQMTTLPELYKVFERC